jgi:LDH2 family malate/lactate/ureidoglycolate dehydrogenase
MHEVRRIIRVRDLARLCVAVLQRAGLSAADAKIVADALCEADLRGVHSHGVVLLPVYFERLCGGGLNPRPQIKLVRDTATTALLDGDHGMGHLAGVKGMGIAIEKAKANGVAVVGVVNTSHYGAGAYYPMLALEHGMIGFATANTPPTIAPSGGTTPSFGNDPISIAIPAGEEHPIVLDIAMSVVAFGKILLAQKRGTSIPTGWAIGPQGEPIEDPERVFPGGSLLPFGGHKGYGLAVVMEVLAGVLTGAAFGLDVPYADEPSVHENIGHLYAALNLAAFIPLLEAKQRVDKLIRQVKASSLVPSVDRVYLPGEIEFETRARRLRHGIPFASAFVTDLESLAARVGHDIAWEAPETPEKE